MKEEVAEAKPEEAPPRESEIPAAKSDI